MKFVKFTDPTGRAALDFAACEMHAKNMSDESLDFVIKDAHEAEVAAESLEKAGHTANAGYYADEVHVYTMERSRRRVAHDSAVEKLAAKAHAKAAKKAARAAARA